MSASNPMAQSRQAIHLVVLSVILLLGGYLRFEGLGVRSLWHDELCTWHVSRLDFRESLRWGPELTKPPLYQIGLRALTRNPHPSEALLRLPAAVCGLLTILAAWWLGTMGGSRQVGAAMAVLCACNGLQIYYSQEARPYTMLLLGCTLSTGLWYYLVTDGRRRYFAPYVAVAVLTLHAHYLAILTIAGHALWWLVTAWPRSSARRTWNFRPLGALAATGVLCIPVVLRYFHYRSSAYQGLSWIDPPTWRTTIDVLGQLTFGWQWAFAVLVPAFLVWVFGAVGISPRPSRHSGGPLFTGRSDFCGLLLASFVCDWLGLLLISWIANPAMIARYALPAGIPAILIPLIVAHRLDRRVPIVLAIVFVVATAPGWISRGYASLHPPQQRTDLGLRELAEYLNAHADPRTSAVVLAIDSGYGDWEEMERLPFRYYPLHDLPLLELRLRPDGRPVENAVLHDPRRLYLVVFRSDPSQILASTSRQMIPIVEGGVSYTQLLFTPCRLAIVAPLANE